MTPDDQKQVLLRTMRWEAEGVISLELEPVGGEPLDGWEPGSHIDVVVGDGSTRQYSLAGRPGAASYRIAVLRESDGRGGSEYLHRGVHVGEVLEIKGPRNHFRIEPAPSYLLIAGGIGITPLLPMIERLEADGESWRAIYYGRSRAGMAFLDELEAYGDKVRLVVKGEGDRLPIETVIAEAGEAALVYVCGPARMLGDAREALESRDAVDRLRTELFAAPDAEPVPVDADTFTIELSRAGLSVEVGPERTVLAAIQSVGVDVVTDCEEGICGSCETRVLEGVPEHRDFVLTAQERAANDCMMVCVSRAAAGCPKLVLDL